MKFKILAMLSLATAMLILGTASVAQPPPRKDGGPGGKKGFGPDGKLGPPSKLVRTVDDMRLSESQRATVVAAIREYEDDGRRLAGMAGANLLLKLKDIVSPDEFIKVRETAERSRGGPERLNIDSVVEHLMSFDKKGTGKIAKDDLPERMQDMFAKGDTNKDGFLDKDEIKKLAAEMAKEQSASTRFAGPGGPGPRGRGNNDRGISPASIVRAVDNLNLTGKAKEMADAAIKSNRDDLRKMTAFARADLLLTMSEVLDIDQRKTLEIALDHEPSFSDRPAGPRPFPPGRGGPPKD
jgi:hypothetical protein